MQQNHSAMLTFASSRDANEQRGSRTVTRALFEPPPFQPEKLSVTYDADASMGCPSLLTRRYTLTHNDITGDLKLTVGSDYNLEQISGFYTRLLRDEVIAEWMFGPQPSLHIYCHVSGEERWLAPPMLRNYIFRREMPLVLETLMYADRQLLSQQPQLRQAQVFVHFQSSEEELDTVELWGTLGERRTWQQIPTSVLKRFFLALIGTKLQPQPPTSPARAAVAREALRAREQQAQAAAQALEVGACSVSRAPVVAALDVVAQAPPSQHPPQPAVTAAPQSPPESAGSQQPSVSVNGSSPLQDGRLQGMDMAAAAVMAAAASNGSSNGSNGSNGSGASSRPVVGAGAGPGSGVGSGGTSDRVDVMAITCSPAVVAATAPVPPPANSLVVESMLFKQGARRVAGKVGQRL
eukprot:CAMPEP_0202858016 /NCGR_PEP_ID=MMETSP1391-20130828/720_1 /ASSEMBLY_ACC=CAM_ASM_000867 /TAXON_ID=1034604 /ORGANISM="Chlamydomonas leiostraca, Strain SAG 11-49" /LENGTH=407 /DNA_ID=CAMNT_0049536881 /DNA_START=150 /DNA_END=1374 /DNA_ORIENTATION=-